MYSKILIEGTIEVITGMHIGGSDAFSAIGAVDKPVIKDGRTQEPIIPGSSLKGKLRTLLARSISQDILLPEPNKDDYDIRRLFGSSEVKKGEEKLMHARLIFSDCYLKNKDELIRSGGMTEVKFENSINRTTAVANPRQIERVVRGAKFGMRIVYDVHDSAELLDDMKYLKKAFELLEMDYLGGHGTRGSGRVKISDLTLKAADDTIPNDLLNEAEAILKGVM
ncbi:MAG: type III-A CRISPR-associated RAMP protein Csm3 [Peptococcaceae bacterium]|nr:type III-A CRISPR-associated RAMP protein Csm3 [Peptococcaceae bacterium]